VCFAKDAPREGLRLFAARDGARAR